MTAATVTDWAALHRDLADVYARHGQLQTATIHGQLAKLHETVRAVDRAWESHLADALLLVEED